MSDASAKKLKIAAWNVMRPTTSSSRAANVIGELNKVDADILILTETNSCIDLSNRYQTCIDTSCLFGSISIGTGPYRQGENRVTIWSKFHGQRRSDMCNSHSGVCALLKCDEWGDLNVYGTILGIYGKNRGKHEPKLPKTDFETAVEVQIMDWLRLASLGNLCVAGDYNTSLRTPLQGDTYISPFGRERIDGCFKQLNIQTLTRDIPNNVDHISLSEKFLKGFNPQPQWEIWNSVRDKTRFSDHMGVCVTLTRSGHSFE
jgi:hypothetical protein